MVGTRSCLEVATSPESSHTLLANTAPSLGAQARAFLGRREAGTDRAELQRTLQELHADVFTQIDQEVGLLSLHAAL